MHTPARWKAADPVCGHRVAHGHQTHYCTCIRAPKLLNRASTVVQLLDRHCDVAESALLHDLRLRLSLSGPQDDLRTDQLRRLEALVLD